MKVGGQEQVAVDPVTGRWTEALFNAARRAGALTDVQGDVERLGAEVEIRTVRDYLLRGKHTGEERLAKLSGLLAGFHPLSRNFVRLLFDRRREEVLVGLAEAFRQRLLVERGTMEGVVESARPLGGPAVERLAGELGRRLGKEVHLQNRIQPQLVGGVRVFVGASMIDRSVLGRLEGLRRKLMEAPMPVASGR